MFSIWYFGLYISLKDKNILIYIVTILFGLIHGYGFGSFLLKTEIENYNLIYGLLGFNIGVELGQIIFVLLLMTILKLMKVLKLDKLKIWFEKLIFIFIVSLGIFWFISRIIN